MDIHREHPEDFKGEFVEAKGNKCSSCGGIGHYRPTCPKLRENDERLGDS